MGLPLGGIITRNSVAICVCCWSAHTSQHTIVLFSALSVKPEEMVAALMGVINATSTAKSDLPVEFKVQIRHLLALIELNVSTRNK